MFTGLIEGVGTVSAIRRVGGEMQIVIEPPFPVTQCRIGESVCVDGACLTITSVGERTIEMDVSGETLSKTTLGERKRGDVVNLERALRLGDRLGGHLVLGHVDGIGSLLKLEPRGRSWFVRVGAGDELSRYIIPKGSVAVDGVSLTVNACEKGFFEVNLIPETQRETGLSRKRAGDTVNIETDMIGKYVDKLLGGRPSGSRGGQGTRIDRDMLARHGFGEKDADR
jgi:riboflavin synthase